MSEQQKAFLSLPVRMGGIGIQDPVESAQLHTSPQETPQQLFQPQSKEEQLEFSIQTHNEKLAKVHARQHGEHRTNDEVKLYAAFKPMDARKRAIMRAVEGKTLN